MKIVLKTLSIALLLMEGIVNAHANSGQIQQLRDQVQALQIQQVLELRDQARGGERQMQRADRRRFGEFSGGGQGTQGNPSQDESKKRMSPEERRALRQQINEAGRDIYAPNR